MGINVLIVDDSSVMRKILGRSLRQAKTSGIDEIVEANDGAEALEKLNGDSVHLIFSDINMPNINGLEFLRRLKETPQKDVPVIVVTTEGGEKTVMEAISLGAKGFIRKPFTTAQMEGAISKVIPE